MCVCSCECAIELGREREHGRMGAAARKGGRPCVCYISRQLRLFTLLSRLRRICLDVVTLGYRCADCRVSVYIIIKLHPFVMLHNKNTRICLLVRPIRLNILAEQCSVCTVQKFRTSTCLSNYLLALQNHIKKRYFRS